MRKPINQSIALILLPGLLFNPTLAYTSSFPPKAILRSCLLVDESITAQAMACPGDVYRQARGIAAGSTIQVNRAANAAKGINLSYSTQEHAALRGQLEKAAASGELRNWPANSRTRRIQAIALHLLRDEEFKLDQFELKLAESAITSSQIDLVLPQWGQQPALYSYEPKLRGWIANLAVGFLSLFISLLPVHHVALPVAAMIVHLNRWASAVQIAYFSINPNRIVLSSPYLEMLPEEYVAVILAHEAVGLATMQSLEARGVGWTGSRERGANRRMETMEAKYAPDLTETLWSVFNGSRLSDRSGRTGEGIVPPLSQEEVANRLHLDLISMAEFHAQSKKFVETTALAFGHPAKDELQEAIEHWKSELRDKLGDRITLVSDYVYLPTSEFMDSRTVPAMAHLDLAHALHSIQNSRPFNLRLTDAKIKLMPNGEIILQASASTEVGGVQEYEMLGITESGTTGHGTTFITIPLGRLEMSALRDMHNDDVSEMECWFRAHEHLDQPLKIEIDKVRVIRSNHATLEDRTAPDIDIPLGDLPHFSSGDELCEAICFRGIEVPFRDWFGDLNLEEFVKRGALAFDVDGTLMLTKETLKDHPELLNIFIELLLRGVRIAFISGNAYERIEARVLDPLRQALELRGRLDVITGVTIYADASTAKYTFDRRGMPIKDRKYGENSQVTLAELEAAQEVLINAAKERFGLNEAQLAQWHAKYRQLEEGPSGTRKIYHLPWADHKPYLPDIVSSAVSSRDDGGQIIAPWIEIRGKVFSIKSLPKIEKADIPDHEVRPGIIAAMKAIPRLNRLFELFDIRPGGSGTIDVAQAKSIAMTDLIESNRLDASEIFYFGDEFYVARFPDGSEVSGNDLSVFKNTDPWINAISVNSSVRAPRNRHMTFEGHSANWIGAENRATHGALVQLIKALDEGGIKQIPPPVPREQKSALNLDELHEVHDIFRLAWEPLTLGVTMGLIGLNPFGYQAGSWIAVGGALSAWIIRQVADAGFSSSNWLFLNLKGRRELQRHA
jgi:hypothetical protein